MSYDTFQPIDLSNIKHKHEILIADIDNSAPLIFWAKNEEDAREKANQVVKKKYNKIWDGHGESELGLRIFKKPHNLQYLGMPYFVGGSYETVYILI